MTLSISVALLHDNARNDPEGHDRHRRAFAHLSRALSGCRGLFPVGIPRRWAASR
ncbi:hypothetical protein [Streptomyces acidicola]|uniref:hypothetical protein n=1 Tax=Streptomyces acidicola TaxID=2596892 RepID=UPI0038065069